MSDLDGLLRTILENPDDNDARLVYADALEEAGHGHHAAFMRYQIESGISHTADVVSRDQWDWRQTVPTPMCDFAPAMVISRGLIDRIECPSDVWGDYGRQVCACHPVRRLTVADKSPFKINEGRFVVYQDVGGSLPSDIPDKVMPFMPESARHSGVNTKGITWHWWVFISPQDASLAIGTACLNWARHANGLPPMFTSRAAAILTH